MKEAKLDRRQLLPMLFPQPAGYLFVSGLAGASRDAAALTDDGDNLFALGGVMGSAVMVGLGIAIGAPDRKVAVITGDGELLMNVGSLVTVASAKPDNLSIVCIDNCRHGETGNQLGHTGRATDIELMAKGAGFTSTLTLRESRDVAAAAGFLAEATGPAVLIAKVKDGPPTKFSRLMDPAGRRLKFRNAFAAP